MMTSLLGYVLLGLLLAWPLLRLLLWLAARSGVYHPRWHYLQAYVPAAQSLEPTPSTPPGEVSE